MGKITGHKHKFAKKPKNTQNDQGGMHGVVTNYPDDRIAYDPGDDFNNMIQLTDQGPMIPLACVESMMCENEELRQTLYAQQNYGQNRAIKTMYQSMGHSTASIKTKIRAISEQTKGALSDQDIYRIVYSILESIYSVDFKYVKKGESKIQYIWRLGLLPIMSIATSLMMSTMSRLHWGAHTEMGRVYARMKYNKKTAKKGKISVKF